MKKRRAYVLVVLMLISFSLLSACGGASSNESTYKYEDLTEAQKSVIDGVYEKYETWKSVYDSGQDWECTNVTFFMEEQQLIFATYYETSSAESGGSGWLTLSGLVSFYKVNRSTGAMSARSYSIYESTEERTAQVQAATGRAFDVELDETAQKDILASEYYETTLE